MRQFFSHWSGRTGEVNNQVNAFLDHNKENALVIDKMNTAYTENGCMLVTMLWHINYAE